MSTSIHDATQLKCYQSLCGEPVEWLRQQWGDAMAVAWKGKANTIAENTEAITRCHTLFANFDPRPKPDPQVYDEKNPFREAPPAPMLSWLFESLAYIYMTEERLLATMIFYFEVVIAMEIGRLVAMDGDPDDKTWQVDDDEVARLAKQAAASFIENHIRVSCFIPDAPQPLLAEHSVGNESRTEAVI